MPYLADHSCTRIIPRHSGSLRSSSAHPDKTTYTEEVTLCFLVATSSKSSSAVSTPLKAPSTPKGCPSVSARDVRWANTGQNRGDGGSRKPSGLAAIGHCCPLLSADDSGAGDGVALRNRGGTCRVGLRHCVRSGARHLSSQFLLRQIGPVLAKSADKLGRI